MIPLKNLLQTSKNIAIIGLSDKPDRPSYQVAEYLISQGYNIFPVNPTISSVFGLKSYKNFKDIPSNIKIDIVDIFRRSDEVLSIIEEVIETGQKPVIWLQEGIFNTAAQDLAKENSLEVITGLCLMKVAKKN